MRFFDEEDKINPMDSPLVQASSPSATSAPQPQPQPQPAPQMTSHEKGRNVYLINQSAANQERSAIMGNGVPNITPVAQRAPTPTPTPAIQSNSFYRANRYGNNPYSQQTLNPLKMQQEQEEAQRLKDEEITRQQEANKNRGVSAQVNVPPTLQQHKEQQATVVKFENIVKQHPGTEKLFGSIQQLVQAGKDNGESSKTIESRIKNFITTTAASKKDNKAQDTLMMLTDPSMDPEARTQLDNILAKQTNGKDLTRGEREFLIKVGAQETAKLNKEKQTATARQWGSDEGAWRGQFSKPTAEDRSEGRPVQGVEGKVTGMTEDGIPLIDGETSDRKVPKKKPTVTAGVLTEDSPPAPVQEAEEDPEVTETVTEETPETSPGSGSSSTSTETTSAVDGADLVGALSEVSPTKSRAQKEADEQEEEDNAPAGLSSTEMWGEALFNFGINLLQGKPIGAAFAQGALSYFDAEKRSNRMGERTELKKQGYTKQSIEAYINSGKESDLKRDKYTEREMDVAQEYALADRYQQRGRETALYDAETKAMADEVFDREAYNDRLGRYEEQLSAANIPQYLREEYYKTGDPKFIYQVVEATEKAKNQAASKGKSLTESQVKSLAWGITAQNALTRFDNHYAEHGSGFDSKNMWTELMDDFSADQKLTHSQVSSWVARRFGPEAARQMDYEMQFITPVLRQESGAAISIGEWMSNSNMYFPRSGNTEQQLKDKQDLRLNKIIEMRSQGEPSIAEWRSKYGTTSNYMLKDGIIYAQDRRTGQIFDLHNL